MPNASFGSTLDKLYAAVARPEGWSDALSELADFVGGPGAGGMLVGNDLARNDGFILVGRLREDLSDLYLREHIRNPYTLSARNAGIARPHLGRSLVDRSVVRRSAMYADILAPQRQQELIIMQCAGLTQGELTGGFGVTLDERGTDQAEHALRRMERIAPHLCHALDLSREIARPRSAERPASLINLLSTAAALLDAQGTILEMNAAAEVLFAPTGGFTISRDRRLACALPDEDRRLRVALRRAVAAKEEDGGSFPQAVRVLRPGGRAPYLVIFTPLPRPDPTFWDLVEPPARILAQIVSADEPVRAEEAALIEAFELTPAEARVAALIASGLSAPQAAAALQVSPNTVRTHLARCFDKTGARSQVALARLVAGLAR